MFGTWQTEKINCVVTFVFQDNVFTSTPLRHHQHRRTAKKHYKKQPLRHCEYNEVQVRPSLIKQPCKETLVCYSSVFMFSCWRRRHLWCFTSRDINSWLHCKPLTISGYHASQSQQTEQRVLWHLSCWCDEITWSLYQLSNVCLLSWTVPMMWEDSLVFTVVHTVLIKIRITIAQTVFTLFSNKFVLKGF